MLLELLVGKRVDDLRRTPPFRLAVQDGMVRHRAGNLLLFGHELLGALTEDGRLRVYRVAEELRPCRLPALQMDLMNAGPPETLHAQLVDFGTRRLVAVGAADMAAAVMADRCGLLRPLSGERLYRPLGDAGFL